MRIHSFLASGFACLILVGTAGSDDVWLSPEGKLTNLKETGELKVILRPTKKQERPDFEAIIKRSASRYGLPVSLIEAVIQAESNWDPSAVSRKGAMGLMQLMPETARMLGVRDPFDPAQNIEGGTKYLAELLKTFNNRLALALAAYNAGPTVVSSLGRIPQNSETPYYVRKVIGVFKSERGISPDIEDENLEVAATESTKKIYIPGETVFLCEDERGKPLITNLPVLRGG